jgi:putative MATE family efflux protein
MMEKPQREPQSARRMAKSPPKFITGSLLGHILLMTGAGAVGLIAIFLGDLANILFLSWLRDEAIIAAVGYASSIAFVTISIGIGLSIAASATVSPAIGAGHNVRARRLSLSAHIWTFIISGILGLVVWLAMPWALEKFGAAGRTKDLAQSYLTILVPSLPMLAVAMTSAAILRSVGDARRAMNVTLAVAIVNVVLDPVMIFGLGLGIDGAALASMVARFVSMSIGLYGVIRVHHLMGRVKLRPLLSDARELGEVAVPAILTNIASPVSNAYVTVAISSFGDGAVAGWAIIGRIIPVAFGAIYALSGSIGPILGQNYGAMDGERLRSAYTLSLKVTSVFTLAAWLLLALVAEPLAAIFHASAQADELVIFFCRWLAPLFVFMGLLFVTNAAFNVLGRAQLSTVLNWGRASLGTVPVVSFGAAVAGAKGVLAGFMAGGVLFGILAVWLGYRLLDELDSGRAAVARPFDGG